jgi:transposase
VIAVMPQMRLLVAVEPVDFRKGIDGLVAVCRQRLQADPMRGAVFVFGSRNRRSIKLLVYDGQGFWLLQKRLSQGRFGWWPKADQGASVQLAAHELQFLLWNGDPTRVQTAPLWRPIGPPSESVAPANKG